MYETATCRYCYKTITARFDGRWTPIGGTPDVSDMCREAPVSVLYHVPSTGTVENPRPEGPYLLHLGVTIDADDLDSDPEPIPADVLAPAFATDGDSWSQWCEPFDGTQRITVRLDVMPDDPDEHAVEAARALRALLALREVKGVSLASSASYTAAEGDWSEWEVVVAVCDA